MSSMGITNMFQLNRNYIVSGIYRLVNAGKEFGITVAQENVERCQSGKLHFLREMSRILGNDAHFVLDVKQAVRAGESPSNILHMLGSHVIHVHISDHGEKGDCLPLGAGEFRIRAFSGNALPIQSGIFCNAGIIPQEFPWNFGFSGELPDVRAHHHQH